MTRPGKAPCTTVAAFDVDGTLTPRDSFLPFLARTAAARVPVAFGRRPITLARALVSRDRDALKAIACSALGGLPAAAVRERGAAYAVELQRSALRGDTLARLRRHQELDHAVVLVSASLDAYLEPFGSLLGVDAVLCTRLEVGADGRLSGSLAGRNCRGVEKARRLRAWLDEEVQAEAEIWAYGDSAGDDAMLALADHPVRVRRARLPTDLPSVA